MPSIYPNDYRTVIATLVRLRKARKITQKQLATAMRVPQSFISKVERCERRLDIAELLHLCEILDIPVTSLLSVIKPRFTGITGGAPETTE
ncbi:helix-turn-helix domain-containing protein [Pantoea stewartii]|uniref:HTH cro/C1-type domain-containing protein n=1 Tax=Pantoea stewartii subsp. stewartii DC283 TaxID=660596 RepID=A0ABM6KDC2_PANSE|nr:helix-turn-helix transcriptional regulator [Pantoea stewartii]ARF52798.1 hypothetical protein DSJ_26695 [Pantoea stewartii subsp. stewartii DC283]KAB0553970.1 helix-turn-helix transcriptional regulator [Pantoea stewartii subsp. stewartii]